MAALTGTRSAERAAVSVNDLDTLRKQLGHVTRSKDTHRDPARRGRRSVRSTISYPISIPNTSSRATSRPSLGLSGHRDVRDNAATEFRGKAIDDATVCKPRLL
jgi:hypothetical protein